MKSLRVEETQNTLIISTNIQEMLSSFVMFPAPQKKESPNLDRSAFYFIMTCNYALKVGNVVVKSQRAVRFVTGELLLASMCEQI